MADTKISTSALLQRLFKTASISRFIRHFEDDITHISFDAHLADICREKGVVPEQVIKKSCIERTYGHQLFNGRRKPSRDKVIQLAFGFGMGFEETQSLLKAARKSALYPKLKRDAVIIFALTRRLGIDDVQATLLEFDLPILGRDERNE